MTKLCRNVTGKIIGSDQVRLRHHFSPSCTILVKGYPGKGTKWGDGIDRF